MIGIYLHLGQDKVVKSSSVLGIFDMDTSTVQKNTRTFLNKAEKEGRVINVSFELPKSFVVCLEEGKIIIYISQLSTATLEKRAENFKNILV